MMRVNNENKETSENPEGHVLKGIGNLKDDRHDQEAENKEVASDGDSQDEDKKILTSGLS